MKLSGSAIISTLYVRLGEPSVLEILIATIISSFM